MSFDGLWPDDQIISWHISVRCNSGFDGQLPLPESVVPGADAVKAIVAAIQTPSCHIVALVGAAGTGKTTALAWLIRSIRTADSAVDIHAFRCLSRETQEIQSFLTQLTPSNDLSWVVIDGVDELEGSRPTSIDELLRPVIHQVQTGSLRVILSFRSNVARTLLVPPAPDLVNTIEWGDAWSGVLTNANLRIAILQLQELRHRDIETYAQQRGLGPEFVAHLRRLYDLRELVRRFFLLVKLCDLSNQMTKSDWLRIRDRNRLYENLLTTWLTTERQRHPGKFTLQVQDLLVVLDRMAWKTPDWDTGNKFNFEDRLSETIALVGGAELRGTDPSTLAEALIEANLLDENGFLHKSVEEFLLARFLANLIRTGDSESLNSSRITDDVIGFLAEDDGFRGWLDQNQDRLSSIYAEYLPHVVRVLHRQGRSVPALDLRGADLSGLDLPGLRLRGAMGGLPRMSILLCGI